MKKQEAWEMVTFWKSAVDQLKEKGNENTRIIQ